MANPIPSFEKKGEGGGEGRGFVFFTIRNWAGATPFFSFQIDIRSP